MMINNNEHGNTLEIPLFIKTLKGKLSEDGKKVQVEAEISETTQRPTIEFCLEDSTQKSITRSIIIGVFEPTTLFTLHVTSSDYLPPLNLVCQVYYEEGEIVDTKNFYLE